MKKIITLLMSALVLSSSLFASRAGTWDVGVEAGYTLGFYDMKGGKLPGKSYDPGHWFGIAVPVEYHFYDWLSIAAALSYEGRGYSSDKEAHFTKEDGKDIWVGVYERSFIEHYFDIPITLRFSIGNEMVRGFLGVGGYIGVRFMTSEMTRMNPAYVSEISSSSYNGTISLNPDADNFFDGGILTELGVGFSFSDSSELYLAARYKYSLTLLDKKYQENMAARYMDVFSLSVGYTFRLGGDK